MTNQTVLVQVSSKSHLIHFISFSSNREHRQGQAGDQVSQMTFDYSIEITFSKWYDCTCYQDTGLERKGMVLKDLCDLAIEHKADRVRVH